MRAGNGRYEVGELLGRGGMAEVFDGRSLGSHGFEKRVAIKRILPELAGDQTFTSRLVVEAKIAVALQHANVVQVLDLVRDGHDVFLVMEFINGPTLRRLLQERYVTGVGPLSPGLSCYIVHEAAAGLDYAHCQPGGAVIHADISPSNLLLSRNGEVKLADFGIARREGIARAAEGKLGYMAPEQERGEPLAPRADLFALGVVLYELLTGIHPFNQRPQHQPRSTEPPAPPHVLRPDLPPRLGRLCMEMLAPELGARPASAKDVMERLAEMRYQQGWREGRSELAAAIAAAVPADDVPSRPVVQRSATERTNAPLTLVTRSLLSERGSAPSASAVTGSPSSSVVVSEGLMALPAVDPPRHGLGLGSGFERSIDPAESTAATLAFATGGVAPTPWSAVELPPRLPTKPSPWMFSTRTWIVLAIATLVGVFWGVRSASRAERAALDDATVLVAGASSADATPATEPLPLPAVESPPMTSTAPPTTDAPAGAAPPVPQVPSAPPIVDLGASPPEIPAPPTPAPTPAPTQRTKPAETGEAGTLRVFSDPWAYVSVAGQRLETPVNVAMRPGRYVVRLSNPELGLSKTQVVRIKSKAATTISNRWVE